MNEHDWKWRPNSIMFKREYFAHPNEFGKQSHVFSSPFWSFELTLPPVKDDVRREIETFLAETEGRDVVNVYDPRVPYPKYYACHITNEGVIDMESIIPDVAVKAVTRGTSSITISGTEGDVISKDDPLAFTHAGVRHYYRASEDLTLTGSDQELRVNIRPRVTILAGSGLDMMVTRIRPTCRFLIDINDIGGLTDVDSFTRYTLRGVEFWGTIL